MIRFIGFDKDGTLFDSMEAYAVNGARALHLWYPQIGFEEARKFIIETAGEESELQLEEILKRHNIFLSKEDIFSRANQWDIELTKGSEIHVFPDVGNSLKNLKENGYKIYVSSFQQESVINQDLLNSKLTQYIDFIAGIKPDHETYLKGLPHFKAAAKFFDISFEEFIKLTVFIGDTKTDIDVAKQAGIISIIRASAEKEKEFKAMGADYIIEDFTKLSDLISSL